MAADLSVIYRIAADITGLEEGVKRGADSTERLEGVVSRVGKALQAAFGIHQIVQFASVTTQAFAEEEAALKKLETALIAQGQATPGVIADYAGLAREFQNTTKFADELILESQAMLVQIGDVMPKDMGRALKATTDLAAGLDIDLRTATLLVGKAFAGETGTLKRYGIVIDETKLKTEGASAVLEAISQKFGGQAQAQLETFSGKLEHFNNTISDGQEKIGEFLTKAANPLLDAFGALPESAQVAASGIAALTPSFDKLALAVIALGGPSGAWAVATAGAGYLSTALLGVGGALAGLGPAIVLVGTLFGAWKLAEWTFGVDNVSNAAHRFTSKLIGLTDAQIASNEAVREANEWKALYDSAALSIDKAARAVPKLADGNRAVGMSAAEAAETIQEMSRQQAVVNAQREVETRLINEQAAAIRENAKIAEETARTKAQWLEFLGLRAIKEAEDEYNRIEGILAAERAAHNELAVLNMNAEAQQMADMDERAQAHRQMLNEINEANMMAEGKRREEREKEAKAWKDQLGEMSDAFMQLSQIGGESLSSLTRGIGTMFGALEMAGKSVGSLKGAFKSFGDGNILAGLAGVTSGISGIIGAASAAIGAVKALINVFRGGEEGTIVNPAREQFFGAHGGTVESVAQQLSDSGIDGNQAREMIQAVFDADTKAEFDAAVGKFGGIPGFARGGLVTQPTLAMVGEGGPELITPLNRMNEYGSEIVVPVTLMADGRNLAKVTVRHWASVLDLQGVATS